MWTEDTIHYLCEKIVGNVKEIQLYHISHKVHSFLTLNTKTISYLAQNGGIAISKVHAVLVLSQLGKYSFCGLINRPEYVKTSVTIILISYTLL